MGEYGSERIVVSDVLRQATTIYRRTIPTGWLLALALLAPAGVVTLVLGSSPASFLSQVVLGVAVAWLVGSIVVRVQAQTENPLDEQTRVGLMREGWTRLR